jgi:AAA+ ATPase superfamily predicted ATPase
MNTLVREVGNWVSGERFWNRQAEIQDFVELIHEGAHILLVAPRRVGKTSLMHEVGRRLSEQYTSIYVDLQKSQTPADAILEISLATREHLGLWKKTRESSATS